MERALVFVLTKGFFSEIMWEVKGMVREEQSWEGGGLFIGAPGLTRSREGYP
jgi:hypothetical protein